MTAAQTAIRMITNDPNVSRQFAQALRAVGLTLTGPALYEQDGYTALFRVDASYTRAVFRWAAFDRKGATIASGGATTEGEARVQAEEEIGRRIDADRLAFADDADVIAVIGCGEYAEKVRG